MLLLQRRPYPFLILLLRKRCARTARRISMATRFQTAPCAVWDCSLSPCRVRLRLASSDRTVLTSGDRFAFWDPTPAASNARSRCSKAGPSAITLSPDGKTLVAKVSNSTSSFLGCRFRQGNQHTRCQKRCCVPSFRPTKTLAVGTGNWKVSFWDGRTAGTYCSSARQKSRQLVQHG